MSHLQLSMLLIIGYTGIHLLAGIYVGLKGPQLYKRLLGAQNEAFQLPPQISWQDIPLPRKKHRGFFRRFSGQMVFVFALMIVVLSYLFPVFEKSQGTAAIIMLLRSVLIMFVWFKIAAPITMKGLNTFIQRKEHVYAQEVQGIINAFPELKYIVRQSWQEGTGLSRGKRLNHFLFHLLLRITKL
jgi:hypothetical protein